MKYNRNMTTSNKILIALITIVFLSSFTTKNSTVYIGTYGVSDSDPSQIKLSIYSDQTFTYQDFSIPDKKINVKGNWTQKGAKLILSANHFGHKFHKVWSFTKNGQVARSRRGITFYRLCKIGL